MKTIRHLIYREIIVACAFISLGFLTLFFFFDFVDELNQIGKNFPGLKHIKYETHHALAYIFLLIPGHLYELLPIAVLIGGVFVMTRFAQNSEFTILRTSGLDPVLAVKILTGLGLIFIAITFIVGDYIAPWTDKTAQLLKARYRGEISIGQTGAWLKETQEQSHFSINVGSLASDGDMRGVRIFEMDSHSNIVSTIIAQSGSFAKDGWLLREVQHNIYQLNEINTTNPLPKIDRKTLPEMLWKTQVNAEMVSVALLKPERMRAWDLFQYIRHLNANGQTAQRYEIQFWKKVIYPLSCLVMLGLALPFGYLHFRSGNITGYVFGGIMLGISFFVLNNIFDYFGNINNWTPWLTAMLPSLIYSIFSLAAFSWLVIKH